MSQVVEVASTAKVYRPRTVFLERAYGSDHVDMGFRLDLFRKDGDNISVELSRGMVRLIHDRARWFLGLVKRNRKRAPKTSKYIGVRFSQNRMDGLMWETQFGADHKRYRKSFASEVDAAKQYNTWCDEMAPYRKRNVIP